MGVRRIATSACTVNFYHFIRLTFCMETGENGEADIAARGTRMSANR